MRVLLGFILIFLVGSANSAAAATLYLDPNQKTINRGDSVTVAIRLDTDEGECINAIDGVLTYSENIVPVDTSRGNSILSVWLEEPTIDKANRTITFAGGIPNGYCGRIVGDPRLTNTVLELVFSSPGLQISTTESGNVASIDFSEQSRALLNDGFGTDAPLQLFGSNITLNKNAGSEVVNDWADRVADDFIPPEEFSITLERSSNAFSNRYFVVFNTTDKQSGIDYYEIIEEPAEDRGLFTWGAVDAPWVTAQSPYVLQDQSLNSTIRVRAYDKAGNEYVATLVPDEAQRTMSLQSKLLLAVIVGVGTAFVVSAAVYFGIRHYNRRREEAYDEAE